jgi:hypothetical protein
VIRKRRDGLQVQVYAGRDPLTGRKRYVSQQVPGQTKASMRQAKQVEARLLEEVGAGQHRGSRSRTMAELLERWLQWRATVKPIAPTTVASYRAALNRYILPWPPARRRLRVLARPGRHQADRPRRHLPPLPAARPPPGRQLPAA